MNGQPTYCKVNSRIDLEEIRFEELEPLVSFGFGDDPDLLDKYQQIKGDFLTMVKRNIKNIEEADVILNLTHYKVYEGDKIVGFTVMDLGKNILFSFGINAQFRTKEVVTAWIEKVKEMLNGLVRCALWNENQRAIDFLLKNGFEVLNKTNALTYLIYI